MIFVGTLFAVTALADFDFDSPRVGLHFIFGPYNTKKSWRESIIDFSSALVQLSNT